MARARNIKPGFFTNDVLAEIDPLGRLLFQGLWCLADREGRLEDRPKKIKAELLPYDDCNADELLRELFERGFIHRYSADGKQFIQVLSFKKHQNPHVKEPASSIPAPCLSGASTVQASEDPEPAGLIPDSGFLIPDPGSQEEMAAVVQALPIKNVETIASPANRSIEIAVYLRQRGIVGSNSANPNISAWGDDARVTNEVLDAALSIVASRKMSPMPGPNYLVPIIEELLNPRAATPRRNGAANNRDASRAAAAASIGLGAPSYDHESTVIDADFRRIA